MDKQISILQELIDTSKYTIVITGAGISMSTGIMDMQNMNVPEVMQITSMTVLRIFPNHYYKLLQKSFLKSMFVNGPSLTHNKLADFEKRGLVQGIITTNIDCLHSLAGSQNVAEIQGSFGVNKCLKCELRYDDVHIWNQGKTPRCRMCEGVIASFPVYSRFGLLNKEFQQASQWMARAELVIVAGSKGYYGDYFNYVNPEAKIVQINPQSTAFDSMAKYNIRKKADEVFRLLG